MKRWSLHFLTVMPSPYMRDAFRAIRAHPRLACRVSYYTAMSADREWAAPELESWERVLPGRTLPGLGASAHWNPSVARVLAGDRSDLVVVMDYSAPTAQRAMAELNRRRRPWVFWGERPGLNGAGGWRGVLRARLQRPLRGASALVAIGSRAEAAYGSLFPGMPVVNIPYLCDLAPLAAAAGAGGARRGAHFLFAGHLIERKGVDLLVSAFARLAAGDPTARLTLCGSGPLEGLVRERLAPFGERVRLRGFLQGEALAAAFAEADVFVLPSRHDGWGVVVNEALGAGLPLVLSDAVGAAADLLEADGNGRRVPAGDADALYEALRALAGDPALRAAFAARSRALSRRWTPEAGAGRWAALCEAVLERPAAEAGP